MNYGKLFACAMMALQVGACFAYAWVGDWHKSTYWFGALIVTMAVTF